MYTDYVITDLNQRIYVDSQGITVNSDNSNLESSCIVVVGLHEIDKGCRLSKHRGQPIMPN